jgi:flagellar basal-body rod protein FlgG
MIYGLYLSAAGVITNAYRQDVISNNLANSETVGFKKNLAMFQQRPTELEEQGGPPTLSNPNLEKLGGGIFASPTAIDQSQGELEPTADPLDVGIIGKGYFAVSDHGQTRLTRDGRFMMDSTGQLVMANGSGQPVLDTKGKPIVLNTAAQTNIAADGQITQDGKPMGRIGVFNVPNPNLLTKEGDNFLKYPDTTRLTASTAKLQSKFLERSNVDPANALVSLMETQRQLEANANMIRIQDQTLDKLVNQVGRIS